jgi:hypothetical protein
MPLQLKANSAMSAYLCASIVAAEGTRRISFLQHGFAPPATSAATIKPNISYRFLRESLPEAS